MSHFYSDGNGMFRIYRRFPVSFGLVTLMNLTPCGIMEVLMDE